MSHKQEKDLGMQGREHALKGRMKRVVGKVQTKFGQITGNRQVEMRGRAKQVEGTVQSAAGRTEQKVGGVFKRSKRHV
jgi:uncharacterized protein YjbJ (UPF0337 family)